MSEGSAILARPSGRIRGGGGGCQEALRVEGQNFRPASGERVERPPVGLLIHSLAEGFRGLALGDATGVAGRNQQRLVRLSCKKGKEENVKKSCDSCFLLRFSSEERIIKGSFLLLVSNYLE